VKRGRVVRALGRGLAIAGVLLAVVAARVVTSSRDELVTGKALRARGDLPGAIVHLRRAARWYAPGSPFHVEALDALSAIGHDAEVRGDTDQALEAERAIRAAIMGARSFYTPEPERLAAADARIADLMSSLPPPPVDAGKSRDRIRAEHLALLEAPSRPHVLWTLVLLFGFAGWLAGAFLFVARAIDAEDRIIGREARIWGTVVIAGFGLFVLGMALA